MAVPHHPLPARSLGHAQLTVGAAAVSLPNIPERTRRVLLRVVDHPVVWTDQEAQEPSAVLGIPLYVSETLIHDDPFHLKLIRLEATDADVRIAYYE